LRSQKASLELDATLRQKLHELGNEDVPRRLGMLEGGLSRPNQTVAPDWSGIKQGKKETSCHLVP
jgi:hypothetical protein